MPTRRIKGTCALATAVAALACAELTSAAESAAASHTSLRRVNEIEARLVAQVNRLRHSSGRRAVSLSAGLARAATAHAISMARGGYFSHSSADGTPFWKRILRYYPTRGFSRWIVGEVLLWSSGDLTPRQALRPWIASPDHRRILLGPGWREIGVCVLRVRAAAGIFRGLDVTIVVADFGARS